MLKITATALLSAAKAESTRQRTTPRMVAQLQIDNLLTAVAWSDNVHLADVRTKNNSN